MPKNSKKEIKEAVKEEVKKEVKKEVSEKKPQKKKGKNWKKEKKEIKKEVKKEVKKESTGPKKAFSVHVTAALGYISGNKDHGPDLKLNVFLHPSLCKSPDEQSAFGPLQAAAAQYGLWRCTKAAIKFTPLVGPSAVSGSVVRCSANLTQTPSSTSWGGLGARKHKDLQAGRAGTFILGKRDLAGPRDGGWWLTDTNNEGAQAAGPIIEAHALGQTMSTYKDEQWLSELFIVELTGTWEFANYTMNPAMGQLERHDASAPMKVVTDSEGKLQLEISSASTLARFMDDPTARESRAGAPSTGEVIYQVVDTAASAISSLVPPPFGWLLKGGWWFVKKIAGLTRTGEERFQIYASLTDAQNNRPVITSTPSQQGNTVTGPLQVTQLNAPNLGGAQNLSVVSLNPPGTWPVQPGPAPQTGHAVCFGKFYKIYKPHSLPNLPPPFVQDAIKIGTQSFYGAVIRLLDYRTLVPQGGGALEAYSTRLDFRSAHNPRLAIPGASSSSGTDTPLFPALYGSQHVGGTDVWLSFVVASNPGANDHWKNGQKRYFYLREHLDGAYKLAASNDTQTAFDVQSTMKIKDAAWLIIFLTDKRFGPGVADARSPTLPVNLGPEEKPTLLGLCLMGGNNDQPIDFAFRGDVWPRTSTALERLAERLGVDSSDLRDALEDQTYESAVEEDSDSASETDDEDEDQCSTSDDFERVPEPDASSAYLNLRENGLTHEQAVEVLKLQQPPPV